MRLKLLAALLCLVPGVSFAFCGFYVGGAGSKLYNNATQVVLMRDGTRTVLSMQNNYQGPPESFAMVVPVPVILQKENVKILDPKIFERIDSMSAPRLVEYWEQNPCGMRGYPSEGTIGFGGGIGRGGAGFASKKVGFYQVTIEAQFEVGEYEIVILSAQDSTGLEAWLQDNKYSIPPGAEPFLKPYVEQGSKFFVAKVDISKVKLKEGKTMLSPLRFHYDAEVFSLPVRLGLINSSGAQDLIVNILAKERYETANYKNVFIPTNLNVAEAAKEQFGEFYAALFDDVMQKNPKSVVTEYSWSAGTCDPCPGPNLNNSDAYSLGGDVMPEGSFSRQCEGRYPMGAGPEVTEGKVTISGDLDKEIVRRVIRRAMPGIKFCYEQALATKPSLGGKVNIKFTIEENGAVSSSAPDGSGIDREVDACVARKIGQLSFPSPKGGSVEVTYPFLFASGGSSSKSTGGGKCTIPITAFTLTRLHARYSADSLGEDLIFQVANHIVGGREFNGADGTLEQGAVESPYGANNFQARYIIRHAWEGEITCQDPQRGIWGGPPNGALNVKPAKELAFVKRGGVNLREMLRPDAKQASKKARPPRGVGGEQSPALPSFQASSGGGFPVSWGFLVAALGGLLLLLLVVTSRPKR